MSQAEFGIFLGVSQGTASKKLNGYIPFSADEIFECAARFNVSTEYLYGRINVPAPEKQCPRMSCNSCAGGERIPSSISVNQRKEPK